MSSEAVVCAAAFALTTCARSGQAFMAARQSVGARHIQGKDWEPAACRTSCEDPRFGLHVCCARPCARNRCSTRSTRSTRSETGVPMPKAACRPIIVTLRQRRPPPTTSLHGSQMAVRGRARRAAGHFHGAPRAAARAERSAEWNSALVSQGEGMSYGRRSLVEQKRSEWGGSSASEPRLRLRSELVDQKKAQWANQEAMLLSPSKGSRLLEEKRKSWAKSSADSMMTSLIT
eukprot:3641756-Pleurochrysis_carterae.AAC.2